MSKMCKEFAQQIHMGIKFDTSIGMACWKIIHYIKNLNHICAMVVWDIWGFGLD